MKGFFRKLFNVYPGEEKNALRFAGLGFLWAMAVTSGLKFADALFLLHVGAESLPTVYTLISCGMLIISSFLLYAFHVFPTHRIFLTAISIGICFYTFAYFCLLSDLGTESKWLWFALRVFGSLSFAVFITCYWTFIDQYHHLQDAKRLYSLFSSMIFLGVASTGTVMRAGLLEFKHVIFIIIGLLLLTAYWILKIVKTVPPVHDENEGESHINQSHNSLRFLIRSILSSRFTLLLMLSNFLTFLLLVITEYNYLSAFDRHFDPTHTLSVGGEEDASLTLFLGQWVALVSVGNIIFGLFIYSRLVRRFGLTSLLMCSPAILLFTFSGWSLNDSLIFPLLGFFVVEGTLYVIDDSNFNLLLNAVPSRLKYKIRVTIESFFEPIGMLMSALLLSFSPIDSKVLGLILAACALVVAFALRAHYLKAIYLNLAENAIHFQRTVQGWFKQMSNKEQKSAEIYLLAMAKHGDEKAKLLAVEGLLGFENQNLLKKLLHQADTWPSPVKMKFIEMLSQSCFAGDEQILDHLHAWLHDEKDVNLKGSIHFYLARLGLLHPEKAIQDLKSRNLILRGAAIISLKKSWAHLPPATATLNRTLAAQQLQLLLDSSDENELCMGLTIAGATFSSHDMDILIPFLLNSSLNVSRTAAIAIAQIADKNSMRHAPVLISLLATGSDNEFRLACLKALGKMSDSTLVKDIIGASIHFRPNERRLAETIIYNMGLRTVPALLSITKDVTKHDRCRVLAGRILGQLALPQLQANLYDIIGREIERAYFYFYYHHTIQAQNPEIDLRILQDALFNSFYSVLDFIIQLLGISGELEDCELLSRCLRSRNQKVRSQVVEALEKTCENKIFRQLQPLVGDLPMEEKIRTYLKSGHKPLSLSQLLDKMSQSPSQLDQIMSATLKHRLGFPNWRESLRKQMSSNEEIFHHFAYELLET